MTYLSHWIPTFAGAAVLAVAGLILRAINRRKEIAAVPHPPRPRVPER
jgi:hypothetical protein